MQHEKEQVALSSIAASAGLTIAKAVVGFLTGSLGILSEAGHSLIDLGATVMTYAAVRVSGKPADEEHHYGHEKFEAVSALAETALLFLLSGIVIWEAITRLVEHGGHEVEATVWAFAVVLGSIVVDAARSRVLTRVAKATKSEALEADALHFTSDIASSAAVLIGLIGVRFFGAPWADSVAALVVAMLVCVAGWRLGKRTINTLTDVAPEGAAKRITEIAAGIAGVVARRPGAGAQSRRQDFRRSDRRGQPPVAARSRRGDQRFGGCRNQTSDGGRGADRHHRSDRTQ